MLIVRSNQSLEEALRFCAAILGMDEKPYIVFIDEGVNCLLQNAIFDQFLVEYLQTAADLAGVYALDDSLREQNISKDILDPALDVAVVDILELSDMVVECTTVTTF
jgi:sulfur relay (sulfurtransferase) DsrF/TusC family protein